MMKITTSNSYSDLMAHYIIKFMDARFKIGIPIQRMPEKLSNKEIIIVKSTYNCDCCKTDVVHDVFVKKHKNAAFISVEDAIDAMIIDGYSRRCLHHRLVDFKVYADADVDADACDDIMFEAQFESDHTPAVTDLVAQQYLRGSISNNAYAHTPGGIVG